jgi:hypothetical protein
LGQCVHANVSERDVKKPSLTIKESRSTFDQAIAVPAQPNFTRLINLYR